MKPIVRIFGIGISLAAFMFVGRAIYRSFDNLQHQLTSSSFLLAIGGSIVAYGIILQLCGIAWYRLVAAIDGPSLRVAPALAIYGKTQIYKYLPSNMLHMIGRYGLAKNAGASHKALTFAQIAELLMVTLASTAVSVMLARTALIHTLEQNGFNVSTSVNIGIVGGIAALVLVCVVVVHIKFKRVGRRAFVSVFLAFVLYALFFVGSGLLVVALSRSLSSAIGMPELIGIGAVAWLFGFVIPGAPGGLGVRETILIAGLSTAGLPATEATAVALGYRIVTILGDCLVAILIAIGEFRK